MPRRESFNPSSDNVIYESRVHPTKIVILSLHIKLRIMKQFVEVPDKTGATFKYLSSKFQKLSEAKLKEGIKIKIFRKND